MSSSNGGYKSVAAAAFFFTVAYQHRFTVIKTRRESLVMFLSKRHDCPPLSQHS